MANKRIELEQYKYYVSLPEEEPNRKTVRKGLLACLIVMMVFCLALFVLTVLSNNLAQNAKNVIEKPPAGASSTPSTTTPSMPIPTSGVAPVETAGLPAGTTDGDLLAQVSTTPTSVELQPSTSPSTSPAGKPRKSALPKYTRGVGNLSNLAKGAGNRGWEIFSLVLAVDLIVLLYFGVRASRLERRSK